MKNREQLNIVVVGHVDHGKSTVIGRLLADTDSLPEGKLEQVKKLCERTAKPFEYAFLLDALENERNQGITVDAARCFFKSQKRDYIIIDAPGHIEFLKNMVTGATRAEAAVLVIDAKEGVRENSRRHGYMLSMLGINQVTVVVNKMDLIDYDRKIYNTIVAEYSEFLQKIDVRPKTFLPVSAFFGENLIKSSEKIAWYQGPALLQVLDDFKKEAEPKDKPFRMPLQDIYKFTSHGDDRRIFAGRVETGTLKIGDPVKFYPSGKTAQVRTIEEFNRPVQNQVAAGYSTGVTLEPEIYLKPGEFMVRQDETQPLVSRRLKVNIFWMGNRPFVREKKYKLKLATMESAAWLDRVESVLDASELSTVHKKQQVDLHDVAECVIETFHPVAFDPVKEIASTGRFVVVDNYEIAGGGIILGDDGQGESLLDEHVENREQNWRRGMITPGLRAGRYGQKATLVVITGTEISKLYETGKLLEESLFRKNRFVYYLGLSNSMLGIYSDLQAGGERSDHLRRLGELAYLFTDAGAILIATVPELDDFEVRTLKSLNKPNDTLVVNLGDGFLSEEAPDFEIPSETVTEEAVRLITNHLRDTNILIDYYL